MRDIIVFFTGFFTALIITGVLSLLGVLTWFYTYIIEPAIVALQNIPGLGNVIT